MRTALPKSCSPDISIVTPCLNGESVLGCCVASVADQSAVKAEHLIQDGGSTDGTLACTGGYPAVAVVSAKDDGMYDALNRGFDRAEAPLFAHLNADEQYLPSTLAKVVDYFSAHPEVDILFGDVLVVDEGGGFICYQKVVLPTHSQTILSHLPTYTAGLFFRRHVWEAGCRFDSSKKALGDSWWMLRALEARYKMARLGDYTSVVTATDDNLSLSATAREESRELFRTAGSVPRLRWAIQYIRYRLTKLLQGCYRQAPFSYSIYVGSHGSTRQRFVVDSPTPFWRQMSRLKGIRYYAEGT